MKTKTLLILLFLFTTKYFLCAQFRIVCNFQHLDNQMVYLKYVNDSLQKQTDSVFSNNGKFIFTGNIAEPTFATITSPDKKIDAVFFFDKGTTALTCNVQLSPYCMASGSSSTKDYTNYRNIYIPTASLLDSLCLKIGENVRAGDTVAANVFQKQVTQIVDESMIALNNFFATHTNSPVSTYLISEYLHGLARVRGDSLLLLMTEANQHSKYAQYRQKIFNALARFSPGNPVADFVLKDTAGKSVSTKDFRGKYYLIDFWASWCGPCRKENPNLLRAYKKYHGKGLDIIGISIDENREKWVAAILQDELPWTQLSDLRGRDNVAAQLYTVKEVPTNFLIDKNGIIIATELRGEALQSKLKEVFGE